MGTDALSEVRVVEFAVFAAGPLVGKHLGEHGAEVIRVESRSRPDGFRVHYPPFKDDRPGLERGGAFAIFNDDVLSVTIDLKNTRGVELAKSLAARADVVIENFVPGVLARLGLGYEELVKVNPETIFLSSCNQGQTGPRAAQRGFGSQLTSMGGFTYLAGYDEDEPPELLYGPYIDFVAAGFGLIAVMAALDYRRRTGKGQYIDLSQYECGVQFVIPAVLEAQVSGVVRGPDGNRNPRAAPHGAYPCKGDDAWCVIAVFEEEEWQALCAAAGHQEWALDERFATLADRKAHEEELDQIISSWTSPLSPREVMDTLQSAGVRAGAVQTIDQLFTCPQLVHRGQWRALEHRELGSFEFEAPPFLLSETPAEIRRPSPLLGEHNDYVFGKLLGMSAEEIENLKASGALT